jgi:hypothetical protein
MQGLRISHWTSKQFLRCIKGAYSLGIGYTADSNDDLIGYTNYRFLHDTWGFGATARQSKKQATVVLSTTNAKYRGVVIAGQGALWILMVLCNLGLPQQSIVLMCDDQSAI